MATVGVSVRIDVTKIDKDKLYKGQKGQYLDLTTFINLDEQDKYGNNGFISQSVSKEERDAGVKTPILGNVKVFYPASNAPAKQEDFALEDDPF
jgi:hypothetical protein